MSDDQAEADALKRGTDAAKGFNDALSTYNKAIRASSASVRDAAEVMNTFPSMEETEESAG